MNPPPTDPYGYCESALREGDRDVWLASLFVPSAVRPYVHAIEAFRLEIAQVRVRVTQPLAGEIRLQWWRDAIFGEARGDAHANPLAAALIDTIDRNGLPRGMLDDAIEAHRIALYGEPVPTMMALEGHFDATIGGFLRLTAMILAGAAADDAPVARHAAGALGIAALLQNFAVDARRGWAAIPSELLQRHGAGQADITTAAATSAIASALADLRVTARDHLSALKDLQKSVSDAAAPAYLRVALVKPALRLFDRAADPFAPAPVLPSWRRQWSLWRASRKGGMGL